MVPHKRVRIPLLLGLFSGVTLLLGSGVAQDKQSKKDPAKLDADHYRLKVETILEPIGKVAIYRVQIWTVNKQEVSLLLQGGQISQQGLSRPENDGKVHRTDFVLLASLRESQDLQKGESKFELEFRCMVAGAPGMTVLTGVLDSSNPLNKVLEVPSAAAIYRLGQEVPVGRFRGKLLEVKVR
jgi:hypothetical protein